MNDRQLTLMLQTRTALHVGEGGGDAVTDAFVRRDASGRPMIPGSSLAGALRAIATRLAPRLGYGPCQAMEPAKREAPACSCNVCRLFGDVNPVDVAASAPAKARTARAGRLWVFDAHPQDSVVPLVRDGVGIERAGRVAARAASVKFDLEVLPSDMKFEVRLEIEGPSVRAGMDSPDADEEERLLAAALSEWVAGRGTVGGRTSRGLGAFAPAAGTSLTYRRFDFKRPDDLLIYLAEDEPWDKATHVETEWLARRIAELRPHMAAGAADDHGVAGSWAELIADVQFAGAMLVSDPIRAAARGMDHAPLIAGGIGGRPVLPGSSVKGVLRSQAERIARTLATVSASREGAGSRTDRFASRCPACDPLAGEPASGLASCDVLLKTRLASDAEADDAHLCLACRLFGSVRRGSRLRVEDAHLRGEPKHKLQDFLAIDRFTGGGADRLKFDASVLWQPTFRIRIFLENPLDWELGWLLLATRDVAQGLTPVGFGGAKGFGCVNDAAWTLRIGYLDPSDRPGGLPLPATSEIDGLYSVTAIHSTETTAWKAAAQGWVTSFVDKVEAFERGRALPALQADSYFGTDSEALYPVMEGEGGDG